MYKALLAFYKSTILPIVRHSFARAGIIMNTGDIMGSVDLNPNTVLERLAVPEVPLDVSFEFPVDMANENAGKPRSRNRSPIPSPSLFAITLAAYVNKVTNKCPLCGGEANHTHHDVSGSD
jgi:hypothetical protein